MQDTEQYLLGQTPPNYNLPTFQEEASQREEIKTEASSIINKDEEEQDKSKKKKKQPKLYTPPLPRPPFFGIGITLIILTVIFEFYVGDGTPPTKITQDYIYNTTWNSTSQKYEGSNYYVPVPCFLYEFVNIIKFIFLNIMTDIIIIAHLVVLYKIFKVKHTDSKACLIILVFIFDLTFLIGILNLFNMEELFFITLLLDGIFIFIWYWYQYGLRQIKKSEFKKIYILWCILFVIAIVILFYSISGGYVKIDVRSIRMQFLQDFVDWMIEKDLHKWLLAALLGLVHTILIMIGYSQWFMDKTKAIIAIVLEIGFLLGMFYLHTILISVGMITFWGGLILLKKVTQRFPKLESHEFKQFQLYTAILVAATLYELILIDKILYKVDINKALNISIANATIANSTSA